MQNCQPMHHFYCMQQSFSTNLVRLIFSFWNLWSWSFTSESCEVCLLFPTFWNHFCCSMSISRLFYERPHIYGTDGPHIENIFFVDPLYIIRVFLLHKTAANHILSDSWANFCLMKLWFSNVSHFYLGSIFFASLWIYWALIDRE